MEFENRIKKEMTEGVVRAILEDAGYRVIDSGIEKVIRELSCLSQVEYRNLDYPEAMKYLPDFTVMDREQKNKYLVEVRYRDKWGKKLFVDMKEKIRIFREIVLIFVVANPPLKEKRDIPSEYLRCCTLRYKDNNYEIELSSQNFRGAPDKRLPRNFYWKKLDTLGDDFDPFWFKTAPLQDIFTGLKERKNSHTLFSAVKSLTGILNTEF